MGARDDPLRGHETSEGAGGSRPRHHAARRAREAALPQRRTDPSNSRPLDRQVSGTPVVSIGGPQEHTGSNKQREPEMESKKDSVTHMHEIYIRASAQAIWDAITDPDWNGKYGYQAVSEYELRP